jgi:hypothetical protein
MESHMDRKIAGLLGAFGALAAGSPAMAETPALEGVMHAASYADLLRPIPNASALLQASDAAMAEGPANVEMVQYHHHHHHRYRRRYRRHHHHHHSMMVFPDESKPV